MKQRILYFDNLKALAIVSVIINHVFWFSFEHNENVWSRLISTYYMPLFFFISGAFAKDSMTLRHVAKKAKQLLLPFLTVGGLYTMLDSNWHELFFGMAHHGYWFLPTLFVIFICFYLRCFLLQIIRIQKCRLKVYFDICYTIILYGGLKVLLHFMDLDISSLLFLNKSHSYLLPFFSGFIVFNYKYYVKTLLNRSVSVLYAISIPLYFILFYLEFYKGLRFPFSSYLLSFLVLFILFVVFRNIKISNLKIQNAISYVGQHTLEIYVIQYFFLPLSQKPSLFLMGGVNLLILSILEASVVLVFSILTIKLIDMNKYLRLLLFGK